MGTIAFKDLRRLWQRAESGEEESLCDDGMQSAAPRADDERIASLQEQLRGLIEELESWPAAAESTGAADTEDPPACVHHSASSAVSATIVRSDRPCARVPPRELASCLYRSAPRPAGPCGAGISLTVSVQPSSRRSRAGSLAPYTRTSALPVLYRPRLRVPELAANWARNRRRLRAWIRSIGAQRAERLQGNTSVEVEAAGAPSSVVPRGEVPSVAPITASGAMAQDEASSEGGSADKLQDPSPGAVQENRGRGFLAGMDGSVHPVLANVLAWLGVLLALASLFALLQELLYWY